MNLYVVLYFETKIYPTSETENEEIEDEEWCAV